jgi:hypothetical protein
MSMPMKMSSYEIPSYVLSHYIIPFAEQCYLVSIEYHYSYYNKLLVILLKDCRRVSGSVHIDLNDVISNLVKRYGVANANIDWLVQDTVAAIYRRLQSYFYHRAEFDLHRPIL